MRYILQMDQMGGSVYTLVTDQVQDFAEELKDKFQKELEETLELHFLENDIICTDDNDYTVFRISTVKAD